MKRALRPTMSQKFCMARGMHALEAASHRTGNRKLPVVGDIYKKLSSFRQHSKPNISALPDDSCSWAPKKVLLGCMLLICARTGASDATEGTQIFCCALHVNVLPCMQASAAFQWAACTPAWWPASTQRLWRACRSWHPALLLWRSVMGR